MAQKQQREPTPLFYKTPAYFAFASRLKKISAAGLERYTNSLTFFPTLPSLPSRGDWQGLLLVCRAGGINAIIALDLEQLYLAHFLTSVWQQHYRDSLLGAQSCSQLFLFITTSSFQLQTIKATEARYKTVSLLTANLDQTLLFILNISICQT